MAEIKVPRIVDAAELRRLAEEQLGVNIKTEPRAVDGPQRLLHELQVHQVELEMQNEELGQARAEMETLLEKYTDLYEFSPVGYFTLERSGTISSVNLTGASLLGVERSLLNSRRFENYVKYAARPAFAAFLEKIFTIHGKETCEMPLRKMGDSPCFVQIEAVVAATGQECRLALIDITERKAAKEALQKVEEAAVVANQKVEEAKAAALLIMETAGMPQNEEEALEFARLSVEKVVETAYQLVKINPGMSQMEKESADFARKKVTEAAEVASLMLKTAAEVAQKQVEEAAVERRQADIALKESEELLRLLIDGAKDYAIFMLDVNGRVTSWNVGAQRLKGWDEKEILGRHFSVFYPVGAVAAGRPEHELEIAMAEGRFAEEGWRVRKDGSKFMADVIIAAIRDESGKLRGFSKVTRDITERLRVDTLKQAKEVAEAATAAKSQFLANMSHELRTPMTGILGMLDLVLLSNLEAEQREFIEISKKSGLSLVRILNDILDLTKIKAGKMSIEEKPFSARECVENTCDIFFPLVKGKGIGLDCAVANDVPDILIGDHARICQVVTNLVGNAVKFTQKGKVELRVTAGASTLGGKREVTFAVSDSGTGIPDDKKHLLFHAFSQVDDSHTRNYGGTGLGLTISKELVERMGGTITFASEERVGSVFTFTLPLAEAPPEKKAQLATNLQSTDAISATPAGERIPRILLVDDEPTIGMMLGVMLKKSRYEMDLAEDGQKAVEMWEQGGYDLVLMDVQMPRLNGFEVTSIIRCREQERGGHTPIIAMTAHAGNEAKEKCLAAGMDDYIAKPIDFRKTLQVIGETLKLFREHEGDCKHNECEVSG